MEIKVGKAAVVVLAGVICMACTSVIAKGKAPAARYPAALHGVWLGSGPEYCKHPDSEGSDSRFVIAQSKLTGYEDWSEPVHIQQISKTPQAWRVASTLHRDDYTFDQVSIMLLSNKGGVLTVVSEKNSMAYYRCA
ncbi:hypothetical protein ASD78_08235 [Lysobacter sp. Root667]|uniref:hypothetical protein n=1 Tax=Lysobacter sp. Root667 TaxID=1736581 RepID=UPI0006FC95AB|nr:hypothetical protein [Lysobacter sp. Root667]KRA75936.1 hypothetical protein ASD78_08235 [Lysobacter sp. Root667]